MAKGRSNGDKDSVITFDKDMAHALVDRAISQLGGAGISLPDEQHDWLYRMGMVGIMASFTARNEPTPTAVYASLTKGVPLSRERWQDVLGE